MSFTATRAESPFELSSAAREALAERVDQAVDRSRRDQAPAGGYRSINPRGTFGAWNLAGPRTTRLRPDGPADTWSAAGTMRSKVKVRLLAAASCVASLIGEYVA